MSAHIWLHNGNKVNNFPSTDPDRLAWKFERQITQRLMEALDAQA